MAVRIPVISDPARNCGHSSSIRGIWLTCARVFLSSAPSRVDAGEVDVFVPEQRLALTIRELEHNLPTKCIFAGIIHPGSPDMSTQGVGVADDFGLNGHDQRGGI